MSIDVVLISIPGAGKGTQGKRIEAHYGIVHLSTGDLIRAEVKQDTYYGRKLRVIKDDGQLVPDDLMIEYLMTKPVRQGRLWDGFPRTVAQAKALDNISRPQYVLALDLPQEIAKERLMARRCCNQCGRVFGLTDGLSNPALCGQCRIPLFTRHDDTTKEIVARRMHEYETLTKPVIAFYEPRGIVKHIDANQPKDKVTEDIFKFLNNTLVNLKY